MSALKVKIYSHGTNRLASGWVDVTDDARSEILDGLLDAFSWAAGGQHIRIELEPDATT